MESATLGAGISTPGLRLRTWRGRSGLTLQQTAALLNERLEASGIERRTDHTQLSRIERGEDTPGLALATCIERLTGIVASAWIRVA